MAWTRSCPKGKAETCWPLSIEMPSRSDVDATAERGRAAGCLSWEPTDMPDPIGYICAVTDPDGNVIEISHNQGVYDTVQQVWGGATTP